MLKKIALIFLVLTLCAVSMTSCFIVVKNDTPTVETEVETVERVETLPPKPDPLEAGKKEAEKALEGLFEDKDLEKKSLTMVASDDAFIKFSSNQGSEYSKALQFQNELISKKLNGTVYVNRQPYQAFLNDIRSAKDTGEFYADLLLVPQRSLGLLRQSGLIQDLNALYGDAFTDECFDAEETLQGVGRTSMYGVIGDGSINPGAYYCVYFNKDLTDRKGLTASLYEAAEKGEWNLDKLIEVAETCMAPGDGEETASKKMGIGADSQGTLINTLFGASGMKFFKTAAGELPTVADNGERFDVFTAKLKELMMFSEVFWLGDDAYERFENGEIVFYVDTLGVSKELSSNIGILPVPKFDAAQEEYHTPTSGEGLVFAVPAVGAHTEYSADLIRAYNETAAVMRDAWLRDFLDNVLRDPESYEMLKIIFENPSYDFAYMYGEVYHSVAESSYNALFQTITSDVNFDAYVNMNTFQFAMETAMIFPVTNG